MSRIVNVLLTGTGSTAVGGTPITVKLDEEVNHNRISRKMRDQ